MTVFTRRQLLGATMRCLSSRTHPLRLGTHQHQLAKRDCRRLLTDHHGSSKRQEKAMLHPFDDLSRSSETGIGPRQPIRLRGRSRPFLLT
jgi:hypothetical protein